MSTAVAILQNLETGRRGAPDLYTPVINIDCFSKQLLHQRQAILL
jgi:hypothetical protein